MKILVTGACGLIGSSVVRYFAKQDHEMVGIDNNLRKFFFGDEGDTSYVRQYLENSLSNFRFFDMDIRDEKSIFDLFKVEHFDAIIHAASQPSHDRARDFPLIDFSVNATGTLVLLEATRNHCPHAPFVFLSTNKVYGDSPNHIAIKELETRWEFDDPQYINGIPETFSIDQSMHSVFGASKVAADVMVQEYGRYFNIPTCCLRGSCLTGPTHSGVELHGFLSYMVKCNLIGREYTVFGYKGKQVRDNIHSLDVARFIENFLENPKVGAIYNLGGGKNNSGSILELFDLVSTISGKEMKWSYDDQHRLGDHICYYSDLTNIRSDYPNWDITKDLQIIIEEIVEDWEKRIKE